MSTKDAVMALVEDVGMKGFGDKDSAFVENDVVLCREVWIATYKGFAPFSILSERLLETLEELGIVDGERGDSGVRRAI